MDPFSQTLISSFGYLGVFVAGFLSTFTIFLPSPSFVVAFFAGAVMNPLLVGLVGGLGAALGEVISYWAAYGGGTLAARKWKIDNTLKRVEAAFQKYRAPVIIFFFAATPLPFDVVGLFCGAIKYPFKWYFLATLAGKIVKYTFLAYAGFYGLTWAIGSFS